MLVGYMRAICPSCGLPRSICSDPDREFYVERTMCYATAAHELIVRRLQRKYKDSPPTPDRRHAMDGMSLWASLDNLSPDDNFV